MDHGLMDLDELVLKCRDDNAKKNIAEAVACYKVGAYRQAIVAAWIAVVYDFIGKLQELELAGDKNAATKVADFEKIRKAGDLRGSLEFEKSIVNMAKDEFELISDIEAIDLNRLIEDRNRCAHPSMQSSDEFYAPSAELARTHIRNAVSYLLQYPPVQGKAAFGRIFSEINSNYFPTMASDAIGIFSSGPLMRPRKSFVRDVVIVLIKSLLLGDLNKVQVLRHYSALNAIRQMHLDIVNQTMGEKLSDAMQRVGDQDLNKCLFFLYKVEDSWNYLRKDLHIKLCSYVRKLPDDKLKEGLINALSIGPLRQDALLKVNILDEDHLLIALSWGPDPAYLERAIQLYVESKNFSEANNRAENLIIPFASELSPSGIETIIRASQENSQIRNSNTKSRVIQAIRDADIVPGEEISAMMSSYEITHDEEDE